MKRSLLSIACAGLMSALLYIPGANAQQTSPGLPASATGIVVVELVNLHCPRCRAVNDSEPVLKQAALAAGEDLRIAPIAYTDQSPWPDRVYYAARDLYPGSEDLVRETLFDGIQTDGLEFEDLAQVLSYLQAHEIPQKLAAQFPNFSLNAIADQASSDAPMYSEAKAARLVSQSGAAAVPVFLWVKDGQIIDAVSPSSDDEGGPQVVQEVLHRLQSKTAGAATH
ncbi:hypothetical protein AB4Y45_35300 [Paraburkholderia sp. EG287A]|uniref:hypothetical protein n=1 Tax=Paraburkholderia sp. EG287A TaxID=3237012 RepID=UPI0034D16F3D